MREEAEKKSGDQAADVRHVVDERQAVTDVEIEGDPEDLWRVNQSSLDSLAVLLNELGGEQA